MASTVRDTATSVTDHVESATAAATHAVRQTTASAPDPVRTTSEATATAVDAIVGNSAATISHAVTRTTGVVDVVTAPVTGTTQHQSADRSPRAARQHVSPARHANSLHQRVSARVFRAPMVEAGDGSVVRSSAAGPATAPRSPGAPGVPTSPAVPAAPSMSAAGPLADLAGLALALPLVIRRSRLRHADVMPAGPTFGPDSSPD